MDVGVVTPRRRRASVQWTRSTLVPLTPAPWRALLIRDVMFSVSFGLSLNPVSWGSSKVLSPIVATGGGDGFLVTLLAFLLWNTFQPPGGGGAAMEAKGFGGPWGGAAGFFFLF